MKFLVLIYIDLYFLSFKIDL